MHLVDVTIRSPHVCATAERICGQSARLGAADKRKTYNGCAHPLAVESYGRFGEDAQATVELLAAAVGGLGVSPSQHPRPKVDSPPQPRTKPAEPRPEKPDQIRVNAHTQQAQQGTAP